MLNINQSVEQLNRFKQKLDKNLDSFFKTKKKEIKIISPFLSEMVDCIHNLCKNGKRLRAAYIYFSYLACGGKNKKEILRLAAFIELIHCYLLIHDDVIDQDDSRRGVPALHAYYWKIHRCRSKKECLKHFGLSMAIMGGDMASAFGYEILAGSKINDKFKNQILTKTNSLVFNTIIGEIFDINLTVKKNFNRKDVFDVYKYKTAQYTIEGPMHIGAIAAGKDNKKILNIFSGYAIPLGIAFQIQDDILGIFGNMEKTGKSIGSDIRENKRTLLVWEAFKKADSGQRKILKNCLGDQNLTQKRIDDFRQVIIETGALYRVKGEADKLLDKSLKAINKAKLRSEGKKFLIGIAEYLIEREY